MPPRDRNRREGRLRLEFTPVETGEAESDDDNDEQLKLAGFRVGHGLYGIDIMRIKEVIQAHPYPVRPVPHAPPIVEGVIALRGVVIPVVDLRKRFGAAAREDPTGGRLEKLVIVSVRGRIVALKVDRIMGELRVPVGGVRPAPSMLRPTSADPISRDGDDFFSGVCRVEDEMVFVVRLETIIDPKIGSVASESAVEGPEPETEENRT